MKFRAKWTWPWGPYFVVSYSQIRLGSRLVDPFCLVKVVSVVFLIIGAENFVSP